ncbi:glycosyltransferase family 2 protein [Thermoflavifilum thermophilum]|uniref:Glycosyltransferase involved in cell wall bisynthesis n=1 Tax=Thermoflavifilum thermophilum TaxID=1393122 RepID=A0A1I7N0R8_9BACT|nr:glycosyltransferase family 2 protein [Thermoflavifilum thermophilum]SFV28262.1 Glycosyltransferase involved in cell wall bisynthesis [Thermoflavifilum thermophilum]
MENAHLPKLSIITVCYQAGKSIERTIQSVITQTYPHIEYIIVDGGSTDETISIIHKYADRISRWISETDKGLYDAMNKGLRLATGDYVMFLNADDYLYANNTIEQVFTFCSQADAYYGETMFVDVMGNPVGLRSAVTPHRLPEKLNWKSLKYGMTVSHQSFIVRRELAPYFDIRYHVCADIDWMIVCLKRCQTVCHTRIVISCFRTGGLSKQRQRKAWKERYLILQKHYGVLPNFFHHLLIVLRYLFSGRRY